MIVVFSSRRRGGLPHSNQIREVVLTDEGIRLLDVVPGPDGVVTGRARAGTTMGKDGA